MPANLKISFATFESAKFAVEHWHYSKSMPSAKSVKFGVWEEGKFKGVVIFSLGANRHIADPYGLKQEEVCELTRIAMQSHETPVSRIVAISLKLLKKSNPGLKLVISYADLDRGHEGKIYQAGGWLFEKICAKDRGIIVKGRLRHRRTLNSIYNTSSIEFIRKKLDPNAKKVVGCGKMKYLMPLDKQTRIKVVKLTSPCPKNVIKQEAEVCV